MVAIYLSDESIHLHLEWIVQQTESSIKTVLELRDRSIKEHIIRVSSHIFSKSTMIKIIAAHMLETVKDMDKIICDTSVFGSFYDAPLAVRLAAFSQLRDMTFQERIEFRRNRGSKHPDMIDLIRQWQSGSIRRRSSGEDLRTLTIYTKVAKNNTEYIVWGEFPGITAENIEVTKNNAHLFVKVKLGFPGDLNTSNYNATIIDGLLRVKFNKLPKTGGICRVVSKSTLEGTYWSSRLAKERPPPAVRSALHERQILSPRGPEK